MVDYSRWNNIESEDDGDELLCTFHYPMGPEEPRMIKFDIRADICNRVGSAVHGDVVLSEAGNIATVIGVQRISGLLPDAGLLQLWCHMEGKRGAGLFSRNEKLRVVGHVQVPARGREDGRAPSEFLDWLRPTFTYRCGLFRASLQKLDIRDDICMKVGGLRHGQVVRRQDDEAEAVVIGVAKDPTTQTVALWFQLRGFPGAGVYEHRDLRKLIAVGSEQVHEARGSSQGEDERSAATAETAETTADVASVAAARAELAHARAELEEERRQLFSMSQDAHGSEILELNVGGTPMSTTRATLRTAGEGSMLAAMFSGNWDRGHKRDAEGRIFLDFDPYCFGRLLSFLRMKAIEQPSALIPFPEVNDRRAEFTALGLYLAAPLFEKRRFVSGTQVRLHRLKQKPELNDNFGWLMHFDLATQRWHVVLRNGSIVSVADSNIEAVTPAPPVIVAS